MSKPITGAPLLFAFIPKNTNCEETSMKKTNKKSSEANQFKQHTAYLCQACRLEGEGKNANCGVEPILCEMEVKIDFLQIREKQNRDGCTRNEICERTQKPKIEDNRLIGVIQSTQHGFSILRTLSAFGPVANFAVWTVQRAISGRDINLVRTVRYPKFQTILSNPEF